MAWLVAWAACLSNPVDAEPAADPSPLGPLPAGWSFAVTDVIALFSNPSPGGTVTIVAPPVMTAQGDIKSAIIEKAPGLLEDLFGEARPAGEPIPLPASDAVAPGLMVPLTVTLEDGGEASVEVTGYPLPGGRVQLFLVASPPGMPDTNPELARARTLVDEWRANGLILNDSLVGEHAPAPADGSESGMAAATSAQAEQSPAPPPDDRVENVIYFLRFVFDGTDPSSAGEPGFVTALLMKDGRVFEQEAQGPSVFDPAARPPGSPGTGRWQRDGEAYALAFADGTQGTAVAAAAKTFAAPAAMSFAGRYTASGGPPSELLASSIEFYPDGSLLVKDAGRTSSGTYAIAVRTISLAIEGRIPGQFLFGYRGDAAAPSLLVIGNRVYERAD